MANKHNRPQIQIRPQGQRPPAPTSEINPSQPLVVVDDDEELDEHEEGALETDAGEIEGGEVVDTVEGDVPVEAAAPDAELVTEAPAPRSTVITPRRSSQGRSEIVEVTPMLTVNRIRIGPSWHHFERGKRVSVPRAIIPFLVERTILAPGTR